MALSSYLFSESVSKLGSFGRNADVELTRGGNLALIRCLFDSLSHLIEKIPKLQ